MMTSHSDITAAASRAEALYRATGGSPGQVRIIHTGKKPPWSASLCEHNAEGESPEQAVSGVLIAVETVAKRQLRAAKDDATKLEEALK